MKSSIHPILWAFLAFSLTHSLPATAAEPILARLAFWVPSAQMAEFEKEYATELVLLLERHGLKESAQPGRATADSIFTRLFEFSSVAEFEERTGALGENSAYIAQLRRLGRRFATQRPDSILAMYFELYQQPAGSGHALQAGRERGHWRTYDASNGLNNVTVYHLLEDRDGNIWIGTVGGGISRYDGHSFRNFTVEDGLAGDWIHGLLEDRNGNIWFGTNAGVSRFDGSNLQNFTTEDGLAGNWIPTILEDRNGNIWFGTNAGVSRFDGSNLQNFTTEDGLAGNWPGGMLEDRNGNIWFGTNAGVSRYDGIIFKNFTTEDGLAGNWILTILEDRNGNVWFGTNAGVSRFDGRQDVGNAFRTFTVEDGLADNSIQSMLEDRKGNLWFATNTGVTRFDPRQNVNRQDVGNAFRTFTVEDGLADNSILSMLEDRNGNLWFGGLGGVSCYDNQQEVGQQDGDRQDIGQTFANFSTQNGLVGNTIKAMLEDRDGNLWFGTNAGVSRYDGNTFHTFTSREGLPSNEITASIQDQQGRFWFTTRTGHLIRYDDQQKVGRQDVGRTFHTFTAADGLGGRVMWAAREDSQGNLWLSKNRSLLGGMSEVVRFDGHRVTTFTMIDGLVYGVVPIQEDSKGRMWFGGVNGVSLYDARQDLDRQDVGQTFRTFMTEKGQIWSILEDRKGDLWFGCKGGVVHYDGQTLQNLPIQDGFPSLVRTIAEDREGNLWFGTYGDGIVRYDGSTFQKFTTRDGLASNFIMHASLLDRSGNLWFATDGAGAICYDGRTFQSLNKEDGLAGNVVRSITEDRDGDLWFGCSGGITRFHKPDSSPLPIIIDAVVADRRHEQPDSLSLPSGFGVMAFEFHGLSSKTRPGALVYQYRLSGHEDTWNTTNQNRVEYEDLPLGSYTFEVEAIDRDLVRSAQSARLPVTVHPPYGMIALACGTGIALFGVLLASGYALKQRQQRARAERALMQDLEEELQTAHDMQMGLMPERAPQIPGVQVIGRCLSANHVGGDFFQYFQPQNRLSICLADVTGHAMEAAIPAVMFDGILKTEMRAAPSLEQLFTNLNQTLAELLRDNTFICFAMGDFDPSTLRIRLSNGGCPYPCHFRASTGELSEVRLEAYPLGVRPDTRYPVEEIQLESRDCVVFCSDGIIEAENPAGDQFGFERTEETIRRGCAEELSPEQLIDRIFSTVEEFSDSAPQGDDRTVVVLKIDPAIA
jgi:ligand-binding sensor domain-containing protein/serine phosphatase RsbU (regulator of sigma subunit)